MVKKSNRARDASDASRDLLPSTCAKMVVVAAVHVVCYDFERLNRNLRQSFIYLLSHKSSSRNWFIFMVWEWREQIVILSKD